MSDQSDGEIERGDRVAVDDPHGGLAISTVAGVSDSWANLTNGATLKIDKLTVIE